MPMDRSRYPANWDEIALLTKNGANWHCQQCGRPCFWPGESVEDFMDRVEIELMAENTPETIEWVNQLYQDKPGRFVLTTAHLDHQPENCDRDNLKALCSVCHLRYDATHHAETRAGKRKGRSQQLTLTFGEDS